MADENDLVLEELAALFDAQIVTESSDFFELGGQSLQAARLAGRLGKATGRQIPVRDVLEGRTVSGITAALKSAHEAASAPVVAVETDGPVPLAFQQQRLWFLDRLNPAIGAAYHLEWALRLRGPLDVDALEAAFHGLVTRHAVLRTRFDASSGEPEQVVDDPDHFVLEQENAEGQSPDAITSRVSALLERPFNLNTGPLYRAHLLRLSADEHILIHGGHHCVLDGWSMSVLNRDLAALYHAARRGAAVNLPLSQLQYRDYAVWQRRQWPDDTILEAVQWWSDYLEGAPDATSMPFDRTRPPHMDHQGGAVPIVVGKSLADALRQLGQSHEATLFMVLETALAVLLYRLGSGPDLVIGTATANRPQPELENLIGFFVNTVALRHKLDPSASFEATLQQSRESVLSALDHAQVPFDAVVDITRPNRSLSHQPLVQVMMVLQNWVESRQDTTLLLDGIDVEPIPAPLERAQFDLSFDLWEDPDGGLRGHLIFATQLFDRSTAEHMAEMYQRLLTAIAAEPDAAICDLTLIDPSERRKLLVEFNRTPDVSREESLLDLFARQVARQPDAPAVLSEATLTYRDLDIASSQLAHHLREKGLATGSVVGVCLNRSPTLITAVLAIWKAGCVYLPLDRNEPAQRRNRITKLADAQLVITDGAHARDFFSATIIIDSPDVVERLHAQTIAAPTRPVARDSLAYIVYTSGSTGSPKGVAVEHGSLARLAREQSNWLLSRDCRRVAMLAAIGFDASLSEIVMTLAAGATLCPIENDLRADPARLAGRLQETDIHAVTLTPNLAELIPSREITSLRLVLLAGDRVGSSAVAPFWPDARVINAYGPTEATVCASAFNIDADCLDRGRIPIGGPVAGTSAYVVDARLTPQPIGVAGELLLGGAQLARGYIGAPALTAERFIADPFSGRHGSRLYRTGDRARWRHDGTLEYLGRTDRQVKIRGMRVEPAEVEAALAALPEVATCTVVGAPSAGSSQTKLVAYWVPLSGEAGTGRADPSTIRKALRARLPDHMIPSDFITLKSLPLTASGKIDQAALPKTDGSIRHSVFVAPATTRERLVADVVGDLLAIPRVSALDDFFDLGGHSLLAARLVSRLGEATKRQLPIRSVFEHRTIAGIASALDETPPTTEDPIRADNHDGPAPLALQQERLWFLDRLDPAVGAAYHMEWALRLTGLLDVDALSSAFQGLVERHAVLRTHFQRMSGEPVQIVADADLFVLTQENLEDLPSDTVSTRVAALLERPFNLQTGPLYRAHLLRLSATEHILIHGGHHCVLDGWSMGVLSRDLEALYQAACGGKAADLPPPELQYGDYAVWQRRQLPDYSVEEKARWWSDYLDGAPEAITLPFDRPRPPRMDHRGGAIPLHIDASVTAALRQLGQRYGATLFMVLETALAVLLFRIGAGREVVIGTATANRPRRELEDLVGFFVNTVPLRHSLDPSASFEATLGQSRESILSALDHADLPFEMVVDATDPGRSLSHHPLVQVMIGLQSWAESPRDTSLALDGVKVVPLPEAPHRSRFDLELSLVPRSGGLDGILFFASQLFDRSSADRLARQYRQLVTEIAASPETPIGDLVLTDEVERHRMLVEFNRTADVSADGTVLDLFLTQVNTRPHAAAIIDEETILSYQDLDRAASRLSGRLRSLGVMRETVVGVCLNRSAVMIMTLLAIWKAGGAYLPLSAGEPPARRNDMLDQANACLVVTGSDTASEFVGPLLTIDSLDAADVPAQTPGSKPLPCLDPDCLAYVIYTSGSTGSPKGVAIDHRGITRLVREPYPGFNKQGRLLHLSHVAFDAATFEIWAPLACGGTVVVSPEKLLTASEIRTVTERHAVTGAFVTTALFHALVREEPTCLTAFESLIVGGEILDPSTVPAVRAACPDLHLFNSYGPTETTTFATFADLAIYDGERPAPLGQPILLTELYVCDPRLNLVPVGVEGELLIGGRGVARGYLGSSGLTAERFIADPFSGRPGARLYRTGDLVRWRDDGMLEFLGRADQQVKIRGMRVEPAEVEAALCTMDGIAEAAVIARRDTLEDGSADSRLVAFLVRDHVADRDEAHLDRDICSDWNTVYTAKHRSFERIGPEELDFTGWVDSATGERYGAEAMLDWREQALRRLRSCRHDRVLEIGCGSGLILSGLAPTTHRYVGIDFNEAVLARTRSKITGNPALSHVELIHAAADDFDSIPEGGFDLIILNSVIQYFPSENYLQRVLNTLLSRLTPDGVLFLGDVRDLRLLECFHADCAMREHNPPRSISTLRSRVRARISQERELLLHPAWFDRFGNRTGLAATAMPRLDHHRTEMALFRFDVMLRRKSTLRPDPIAVRWIEAQTERTLVDALDDILGNSVAEAVGIASLPDPRLQEPLRQWRAIEYGTDHERPNDQANADPPFDLAELDRLSQRLHRRLVPVLTDKPGLIDVLLLPGDATIHDVARRLRSDPGTALANWPGGVHLDQTFIRKINGHLRSLLPDHMVPASFVGLTGLPLTASGKIDRKALPSIDGDVSRAAFAAPVTELERSVAEAVEQLLGLTGLGTGDDFFDLGGHSLLAVRLVTRLAEMTGRELPVRSVFETRTVRGIAAALGQVEDAANGPIPVATDDRPAPLSLQQERLWFLDQLDPAAGAAYHMEWALRLTGPLDCDALEAAFCELVSRHHILRTHFEDLDGEPVQRLDEVDRFTMGVEDGAGMTQTDLSARIEILLRRPFDLRQGPLFRVHLLRLSPQQHVLVYGGHHSVLDGWSLRILTRELATLYEAARSGGTINLLPLDIQYGDYARWQRRQDRSREEAQWWSDTLADVPEPIALPFDRPRPARMDHRGAAVPLRIEEPLAQALRTLGQREGATLFMVLETALAVLLSRLGAGFDLVIGTVSANRQRRELEDLIGFFVNTVALRHKLNSGASFATTLQLGRDTILSALEHGHMPFEAVVEAARPKRSLSHPPLIQVMMVLQNWTDHEHDGRLTLDGLQVDPWPSPGGHAQFDLSLDLWEEGPKDGISGRLIYASQLFDRSTAERLAGMYIQLLSAIAVAPETAIADFDLIGDEQRKRLLMDFNPPELKSTDATVLDQFTRQVAANPNGTAIVDGPTELNYHELDMAADCLARRLVTSGVGPETIVGVCLERSAFLVVALLAVWKAGGVYMPISRTEPPARRQLMIKHVAPCLVLAGGAFVNEFTCPVLPVDHATLVASQGDANDITATSRPQPDHLAYAIFTSGSTGTPKCVCVPHGSLARLAEEQGRWLGQHDCRHLGMVASIGFDASLSEIVMALSSGGTLYPIDDETRTDPAKLARALTRNDIQAITLTPGVAERLPQLDGSSLRLVILAGDTVGKASVAPFRPRSRIINAYGPTEATVCSSAFEIDDASLDRSVIPIGKPVAGTQAYVVDNRLALQPIGVPGELLLGGNQLAWGYLGDPGLTADRFIADPFSGKPSGRLYRTGDRVRWREDGMLEYLGRIDNQIKIRGIRVEPAEVETALARNPAIAACAVVGRPDATSGETRLVAYLVPSSGEHGGATDQAPQTRPAASVFDIGQIRAELATQLPSAMIPSAFVAIDHLPLGAAGKLNRLALPLGEVDVAKRHMVAPSTPLEAAVADTVSLLLGQDGIGMLDNFFDLGGHSLSVGRLAGQLTEKTGRPITIRTIFECGTLADIAAALEAVHLTPDEEAIQTLRENPKLRPHFDLMFGQGASAAYLKNG